MILSFAAEAHQFFRWPPRRLRGYTFCYRLLAKSRMICVITEVCYLKADLSMHYATTGLLLFTGLLAQVTLRANPQTQEKLDQLSEGHAGKSGCHPQAQLTQANFESVMQTVQDAWKEGNAQEAAECFNEDAIFSAPPVSGRKGRENLYQYFALRR
jgi:predicted transcriptional regulator